jgi:hypothetical protein
MDVHHAVRKRGQHHAREQPHKASAYDQLDAVLAQRLDQRAVEVLARREAAMLDDAGWDAVAASTLQTLHAGAVGNHDADLGAQLTTSGGVDDRLQVGAGAGNQYSQFDRRALCHRASLRLPPTARA